MLIATRDGGGTYIAAVRRPGDRLAEMETLGMRILEKSTSEPTDHGMLIERQIHRRLSLMSLSPGNMPCPWFAIDFERAQQVVAEYDLATGQRTAGPAIAPGMLVFVHGFGLGISQHCVGDRLQVQSLMRPLTHLIIAPMSLVQVVDPLYSHQLASTVTQ